MAPTSVPCASSSGAHETHNDGKITRCELQRDPAVVYFAVHASALEAKEAVLPDLCDGMDTLYNERSYDGSSDDDGRGWCVPDPPS